MPYKIFRKWSVFRSYELKYSLKNARSLADFPAVTWIYPYFVQMGDTGLANDDHAPNDVLLSAPGKVPGWGYALEIHR